jgi:hypothetical protein
MALTVIEQLCLWGPPALVLLLSGAYYFRWGKEADGGTRTGTPRSTEGGDS